MKRGNCAVRSARATGLATLSLLIVTGLPSECVAQEPVASAPPALVCRVDGVTPGRGRICVQLSIRQGRPFVEPGAVFVANGLPATISPEDVLATLQSLLMAMKLTCDASPAACVLPDSVQPSCLGPALDASPWAAFWEREQEICGDQMGSGVAQMGGAFDRLGPASPFGLGALSDRFESDIGVVRLQVSAFTRAATLRIVGSIDAAQREKDLRRELAPLEDRLWDDTEITAAVQRYYRALGITPLSVAPNRSDESVTIVEARRMRGVALPAMPDPTDPAQRRARLQSLYQLLDDHEFHALLDARASSGQDALSVNGVEFVRDLHRQVCEEPFWVEGRMARPKMALSAVGLALQPALATTRPPNEVCDDANMVTAQVTATDTAPKEARPKPRFVGVELQYRPGQGSSLRSVYQQDMLALPQADLRGGVKLGREGDLNAGQFDVTADYIAFERLQRRLTFTASAIDTATPQRFIEGALRDERRQGQQAQMMLELFRDRDGRRLAVTTGLQRTRVSTRDALGAGEQLDLLAWHLGADWRAESLTRLLPWNARVQPSLVVGRVRGEGLSYRKSAVQGTLHVNLERGLALDFAARAEAASHDTPEVEQASLGGAESVRGFREDDAIGRRLWSLQSELWLPMVKIGHGTWNDYLGKLRFAPFIDVGGVSGPARFSQAGPRQGAGLGLRLLLDPIVVKLDYAWRHGTADTIGPRSRVHFSMNGDIEF